MRNSLITRLLVWLLVIAQPLTALSGTVISLSAVNTLNNTGGVVQGLGAGSSATLNARDIILRTTTQTSTASIQGPNGESTGTRTNVDRIATVGADSVTLAALGNIQLAGASINATGNLAMTAGGTLTSEAVQTGYTLNIPMGGNTQGRSSYYDLSATTQQLSTLNGNNVAIKATGDANFKGTNVTAANDLSVTAKNITIEGAKDSLAIDQQGVNRNGYERVAKADETLTGGSFTAGNNVSLIADGDKATGQGNITGIGAKIATTGGQASLIANNDVNLLNATTQHSELAQSHDSNKGLLTRESTTRESSSQTNQVNASAVAGNTVLMQGGNDVNIRASTVMADNGLQVTATRDINLLTAGQDSSASSYFEHNKSGLSASFGQISVGKASQDQTQTVQSTSQVASVLSGANVNLKAGRDATLGVGVLLADENVDVTAGRNINLLVATDTQTTQNQAHSSSTLIGLAPTGLSGRFTAFAQNSAAQDGSTTITSQSTGLISANNGNVTLTAGTDAQYRGTGQGNVVIQGGDLLAKGKVTVTGNRVDLQAAQDTSSGVSHAESKSITMGSALTGVVGSQLVAIEDKLTEAGNTSNSRLQGALALKAGYDAYKLAGNIDQQTSAANAAAQPNGDPGAAAFGISVSIGTSRSRQDSTESATSQRGTNVQAQTLNITARDTDINTAGAKLQASDIVLDAARDINLGAAVNTSQLQSSNSGSGASLGVTFGLGQQSGISFQASASKTQGNASGSEVSYDNTLITATNKLVVKSGGDTHLAGAQLAANRIEADIKGELTIQTLQDTSSYQSQQTQSGFGISLCIPPLCLGAPVSGSVSAGKQTLDHSYESATGQSGIAAGAGGFDLKVAGLTTLQGGAITSQAAKDANSLTTAGIVYSDLTNTQNTDASSQSASLGFGGGSLAATVGQNIKANVLTNALGGAGQPDSASQSGVTQSVISPANITLTSTDATINAASQQAVATLTTRDASTANASLVNTLTLQQAQALTDQQRLAQENQRAAELVGAVVTNVIGDVAAHNQWADGSTQKLVLHGLAGLVQAKLGGGSALAGAAAGVAQEALAPVLADFLTANGIPRYLPDGKANPDFTALMQAGASLTGAAVGAIAAGGGSAGAGTGASVAVTGVTNNFLKHDQATAMNKQLNDCKAKPGGCRMEESDAIFKSYKALSDANIAQVQACKLTGDVACVNNLLGVAALPGEVTNTALSTQQETLLYGRATNAAYTGSVTGSTTPGNTDADQALKVAQFKQANCLNPKDAECDAQVLNAVAKGQIAGLVLAGAALGFAPTVAVAVATPAATAAAIAAVRACAASPVMCANQVGLVVADALGGEALGGASIAGGAAAAGSKVVKTAAQIEAEVAAASKGASGANGGATAVGEIGSGVRVYPDGSLRTPDGKFASVSGSPAPGTTAAANYADFLSKNGVNVVGQEMVVNGPLGPRRYDIVVKDAAGNLQGIEIKSGGATKTTYQDFTDRFVNQFGAPGAGKLDGKSVTSTITIYVP